MPRLSVEQLAFDPEYDPATAPATAMAFESTDALYALRDERVPILRSAAANVDDGHAAGQFLCLARRLSGRKVHRTMADPLYMHEARRAVGSGVWRLLDQTTIGKTARFVTIIQRDAQYRGNEPIPFDPRRLKGSLQSAMNRCGARDADGFLMLWLEGDYHPLTRNGQAHWHGLVGGGMVGVMERLMETDKFLSSKASTLRPRYRPNLGDPVIDPIRLRGPLFGLPRPILYCLKQRWWARPVDVTAADGRWSSFEAKARPMPCIPEAYSLLWRDQHSLSDITLMMGVYVGREGLALSK